METLLNWKKGFFSNTCGIYSNGELVGSLKEDNWRQRAYGELNGKKVSFKTQGFFKRDNLIIDPNSDSIIGKISFNAWMTKATIERNNKVVIWKFDNVWNTKWSISNTDGVQIRYKGLTSRGFIEYQTLDELLIISGLHITNYYRQISMAATSVVFLPICVLEL